MVTNTHDRTILGFAAKPEDISAKVASSQEAISSSKDLGNLIGTRPNLG